MQKEVKAEVNLFFSICEYVLDLGFSFPSDRHLISNSLPI